jgi:RNA polymerase-binding transcription factor DksA
MSADLATGSPTQHAISSAPARPDFGQEMDIPAYLTHEALPRWRALLEFHWRARLERVTELSLAYHDAEEATTTIAGPRQDAAAREGQRLLRETVSERRALAEIEAALTRLGAGSFGSCERCGGSISAARLTRTPQTRYCSACDR